MTLPLSRRYAPMEAKLVDELPSGPQWQYEPKWDGFRCLAFRDGAKVELMSKSGKPLTRYFPEVVEGLLASPAPRFVLDGEIVVPEGDALDFDALLQRVHPAASRVAKLSRETPAAYVVFDLLVDERGGSLAGLSLAERRERLEQFAARQLPEETGAVLSPVTSELATVKRWLRAVGGGLDGVVAKRRDLDYRSGDRSGMQKVKTMRTADCVVGGFRYASKGREVGSLLLGLYDEGGLLHHVGFASNIPAADKPSLTKKLERLIKAPGFTGQAPGGPSRWSTERSAEWKPLAPRLVAEVRYDHFDQGRFRHGTAFLRWRPDKAPRRCSIEQVEQEGRSALALLG
jgi:ATP-dependent DNA ligase